MPKRRAAGSAPKGGESLVDWRESEANTGVLDWRARARQFGLVPIEDDGELDDSPRADPVGRLLEEEEPEAFVGQQVEEHDADPIRPEETEDAAETGLAHD